MTALQTGPPGYSPRSAAAAPTPADPGSRPDPCAQSDRPRHDGEDSAAHLVRLCLDLQLDALLLTLGAASVEKTQPGGAPWRRWLSEDVDLACTLAADVLAGRAALPTILGTPMDRAVPAAVIDNLTARYACMRDLLTSLQRRLGSDQHHNQDDGSPDPAACAAPPSDVWRPRIAQALDRCQRRLAELGEHQLAATSTVRGAPHHGGRPYLPGELLG